MQLNFAPATAHHSTPARWPALLTGLFSGRSTKKATQPHPADYRSNGLQSHEELPMAHQGSTMPAAAAATMIADEPQAARPPRLVPYIAFFVAVFASMAAAAAVVSNDLPVMVVGLM